MYEKNLVLDTCALIWLASEDKTLSAQALNLIDNASIVYVSTISAWEISLESVRGSLQLPMKPDKWFDLALKNHNLTLAPLDVSIMIEANNLPWHHKDPADRFIIATAIKVNAAIEPGLSDTTSALYSTVK